MGKKRSIAASVGATCLLAALLLPFPLSALDLNRKLTQYAPASLVNTTRAAAGNGDLQLSHLANRGWVSVDCDTKWLVSYRRDTASTSASSLFPWPLRRMFGCATAFYRIHARLITGSGTVGAGVFEASFKNGLKHYTNQNGLPSSSVRCVVPGGGGSVWVCTDHGLARLDAEKDGRIETFGTKDGLGSEGITAGCMAQDGKFWAAGRGPYLNLWNGACGSFSRREIQGLPSDLAVFSLLCSGDDIWVGTNVGLLRVSDSGSRLYTAKDGLADNLVFTLSEGKQPGSLDWHPKRPYSRLHEGENSIAFEPKMDCRKELFFPFMKTAKEAFG